MQHCLSRLQNVLESSGQSALESLLADQSALKLVHDNFLDQGMKLCREKKKPIGSPQLELLAREGFCRSSAGALRVPGKLISGHIQVENIALKSPRQQ